MRITKNIELSDMIIYGSTAVIGLVIGIILIGTGIVRQIDNSDFMKTAVPVEAECESVYGNITKGLYAYVTYEYEGMHYHKAKVEIGGSEIPDRAGTVKGYISPNNPNDFRVRHDDYPEYGLGMAVISAGFIFTGFGLLLASMRNRKWNKVHETTWR